ncbi:TraR/DksA family transcriptional regulator [Streptomyces griseoviridis]
MSLDAAPADPRLERLTPGEARRRLEHARSSRTAQLRALTANGQDTDHLTTAQAEAIRQVLKEIDDAFTRLDEGTYGTCLGCSEAVPVERLEILPHTSHCVPCRRRATATAV